MFQSGSKLTPTRRGSLEKRTAKWWRRAGSKEHGFWYRSCDGERITAAKDVARIKALVIPPAWTDVRISPRGKSALQAVGRDSRGRPQYLYHSKFVEARERKKFERVPILATYLSRVRRRTSRHLAASDLSKESVLAAIVRLIDALHFRLGSDRSVREYQTFGITTLRSRHVSIHQDETGTPLEVEFNFVGKHHIRHKKVLRDRSLAAILCELKSLRGSRLFKYVTADGVVKNVRPQDVNDYIRSISLPDFTSKDFRTWAATLHAAQELSKLGVAETKTERKRRVVAAIRKVAERLGNTVAVCRSSYIHPAVIRAYEVGRTLNDYMKRSASRKMRAEEAALVRMLRAPLPQPR
jgi:DNA topoisomerase-1